MIVEKKQTTDMKVGDNVSSLGSTLSYLVLLAGIVTLLFSLFITIRSYSAVWFEDQWTINAEILLFGGHHPLQLLWQQHNEHRIPIVKLLAMMDIYLFKGRNLLLYVCSWAIQASMLGLSAYLVIKFGNFAAWQRRTVLGLIAFCEFNPAQLENFTWAFQSIFFMAFFFALVAICCLAVYSERMERQPERMHSGLLWLCVGAAFLAECSIASGLICWIVLPFCVGILGLQRTLLRPIVVFGVLAIGIYLIGYHSPAGHTSPMSALRQPFEILGYIQTFFGSSWDYLSRSFGMFISPIAISFVAGIWTKSIFDRVRHNRLYAVALSMAILCLLTAIMTALGRLNFGTNQATASRYQTPAMLFWCFGAIAFLTLSGVSLRRQRRHFFAVQLACLILFFFQAKSYGAILAEYDLMAFSRNVGGLALESGIDQQRVKNIFPNLTPIKWYRSMRDHKLIPPVFPEYSNVGKPLSAVYQLASTKQCQGFLDAIQTMDGDRGQLSASGWASVPSILGQSSTIILVANDGKIVGLGVTGMPRPDVTAAGILPARELNSGWYGLAKVNSDEKMIQAYEKLPGGNNVCLLNGLKAVAP